MLISALLQQASAEETTVYGEWINKLLCTHVTHISGNKKEGSTDTQYNMDET